MPTLKVARKHTVAVRAEFGSVWSIVDTRNICYEGEGVYSYVGSGDGCQEDTGLIKTKFPLDPTRTGGISTFEITLTETGKLLGSQGCLRTILPAYNIAWYNIAWINLNIQTRARLGVVWQTTPL